MDKPEILLRNHIEKVVTLSDIEFEFVIKHFSLQNFKKRASIIHEGAVVSHVYFLLSGLVKLVLIDSSAKEHIISFAMEDWWETDFHAFYTQQKASLNLACIENTTVYGLTLEDFNTLCVGSHKMQYFFLQKSIAGHISSQTRILSFLTSNAQQRYEQLLLSSPSLIQRVPKTVLASYLGVSRETLSRFFQ